MRILLDHGTPVPLRRFLHPHSVDTAFERGWSTMANGELLAGASRDGYDAFITTDQNIKHQQNVAGLTLGIVVMLSASWPRIRNRVGEIRDALDSVAGGDLVEVPG